MKSFTRFLLAALTFSFVNCQFNDTLTKWIKTENVTALGRIFANIAPLGQYASDGDPGAVVAAPSTNNPNYYYQITTLHRLILWLTCTGFGTPL